MHLSSRFIGNVRVAALAVGCVCGSSHAMDHLQWRRDGAEQEAAGRIVIEAQDGGVLFETQSGTLWALQADEIVGRRSDDTPFAGLTGDEIVRHVQQELGVEFQVHQSAHFTLLYSTSPEYAKWCGLLYERLYAGFYNFWKTRGWRLNEPDLPLVAVVFHDKESYLRVARRELGEAADGIVGYYSLHSNRIYTYDLTGVNGLQQAAPSRSRSSQIQAILAQPQAVPMIATLIHEATHQLSYNSGLQSRYFENPVWVSEGLAIYFETPDISSGGGWRTIGRVNDDRLRRFREYLGSRPADSLRQLVANDDRMRSPDTAVDAYAESWALCYFLLRVHGGKFTDYLRQQSQRPVLSTMTPEERVEAFELAFGKPIEELDADFLRYVTRLR